MKKQIIILICFLVISSVPSTSFAQVQQDVIFGDYEAPRVLSHSERVGIIDEITSPTLNVQIFKKDGTLAKGLKYYIENIQTGEVISKGETNNGVIKEQIVVSEIAKEVVMNEKYDATYTDYALRVFNVDEDEFVMYFFSVPVFENLENIIDNLQDGDIEDLLWIHHANFKQTNYTSILQDVYGYEEENELLSLTLRDDNNTTFSPEQSFYLSSYCSLQSTENRNTRIGRLTGNENLESRLTINNSANVRIDVGVDGVASGSITRGTTEQLVLNHAPRSASTRVLGGIYQYGQYNCYTGYHWPRSWTEVRAIRFQAPGGTMNTLYGIDGDTPRGIVGRLDRPGDSWTYTVNNGFRFNAAVTVYGVTLGTQVAYANRHSYRFTAKNRGSFIFDNNTGRTVWYSTPIK